MTEKKRGRPKKDYSTITHITCKICGETKSKEEYYNNKWSYCKPCWTENNKPQRDKFNKKMLETRPKSTKTLLKEAKKEEIVNNIDIDTSFLSEPILTDYELEQLELEKAEEERIKQYKLELLSESEVELEEKQVKSVKKYTAIDDDEISYDLNPYSDNTILQQLEELRVSSCIIYENGVEIGIKDGSEVIWSNSNRQKLSFLNKQSKKLAEYLITFKDGGTEIHTQNSFKNKYDSFPNPRYIIENKNSKFNKLGIVGIKKIEKVNKE